MSDVEQANAAFIVRACNNHDSLVSELRNLIFAAEGGNMGTVYEVERALPSARAALARAQSTGA